MLHYSLRAMNTDCLLIVNSGAGLPDAATALQRGAAQITEYERRFSRFRADSDLTYLNEQSSRQVAVTPQLAAILSRALEYRALTGGVFSPLVLNDLEALGYDRSFEFVSGREHTRAQTAVAEIARAPVRVDTLRAVVTRAPGTRVDLGGVAKGAAADAALAEIKAFPGALVDLGGDIRVAGVPDDAPAWIIDVDNPAGGASPGRLEITDGAVATSSVTKRRWLANGKPVHHLIDPRSRQPAANGVLQCTAITDTAEHADVAAKVGLILGAGSLQEDAGVGPALHLRGMAWMMADGSYCCSDGWMACARS